MKLSVYTLFAKKHFFIYVPFVHNQRCEHNTSTVTRIMTYNGIKNSRNHFVIYNYNRFHKIGDFFVLLIKFSSAGKLGIVSVLIN